MTFTFFISTAAVSAIVSGIVGIVTALITRKTTLESAREAANQEIQKLERTWEREDIVSSDEEFADMAAMVTRFIACHDGNFSIEASEKIAAIRSKESGEIGKIMDRLYTCAMEDSFQDAEALLTEAINEKRKIKDQLCKTLSSSK